MTLACSKQKQPESQLFGWAALILFLTLRPADISCVTTTTTSTMSTRPTLSGISAAAQPADNSITSIR